MTCVTVQEVCIANWRAGVGNNVITITTVNHIRLVTTIKAVIATIAP